MLVTQYVAVHSCIQSLRHEGSEEGVQWGAQSQHLLGGAAGEGMTTTSSLMPAMLMRLPKGLWLFSAAPPAGSVSVSCPVWAS